MSWLPPFSRGGAVRAASRAASSSAAGRPASPAAHWGVPGARRAAGRRRGRDVKSRTCRSGDTGSRIVPSAHTSRSSAAATRDPVVCALCRHPPCPVIPPVIPGAARHRARFPAGRGSRPTAGPRPVFTAVSPARRHRAGRHGDPRKGGGNAVGRDLRGLARGEQQSRLEAVERAGPDDAELHELDLAAREPAGRRAVGERGSGRSARFPRMAWPCCLWVRAVSGSEPDRGTASMLLISRTAGFLRQLACPGRRGPAPGSLTGAGTPMRAGRVTARRPGRAAGRPRPGTGHGPRSSG